MERFTVCRVSYILEVIAVFTPLLDPQSRQPLYEQIYRQIRAEIEAGRLPQGARLPSKRTLAAHLKVSVVTVEGAYSQLMAEGYIRTEPKRGFFVQAVLPQTTQAAGPPPAPVPIHPAGRPEYAYDFTTNAVDTVHFPFSTWARLMREVLSLEDSGLLSATHPQGTPELRAAIVRYLYDFRGIRAQPEQVVVGAGSEYLTSLLFQLLGREGGYAVEDPGYHKFQRILAHAGALICPIPLDNQGLRVDALRWSGARVVHVTPSHHFPQGTVMPIPRRQALLSWAAEQPGRYIIEDDYDSEFRFSGRPIPALQSLDTGGRVIYLNTFAKSLAPSLRIGYMVLPPELLERYWAEFDFYSSTVPSFEQLTLARFLVRGHFERHIARMRTVYKGRRDALITAAAAAGVAQPEQFSGGEAGLHLLLQLPGRMGESELVRRAADHGVGVSPFSAYYLTPPSADLPPTLIMGYARLEAASMLPAFQRLALAWGMGP